MNIDGKLCKALLRVCFLLMISYIVRHNEEVYTIFEMQMEAVRKIIITVGSQH